MGNPEKNRDRKSKAATGTKPGKAAAAESVYASGAASATETATEPGAAPSGELYGTVAIRENQLEPWPNPHPERPYLIYFDIPEFTCLCPRSGFPDFALIKVRYQPQDLIVELRSLKLYINGFRDRHISHEGAANQILDDLVALLDPRWMRVTADFTVRGNIKTVVTVEHGTRERVSTREQA